MQSLLVASWRRLPRAPTDRIRDGAPAAANVTLRALHADCGKRTRAAAAAASCSATCAKAACSEDLCAGRIGKGGIAGEGEGLAAAAAPVLLAELAGAARLAHPRRAAECSGRRRNSSQMSRSVLSRTLSKTRPGSDSAAWQGSTLPDGVMLMMPRPQPPMQGLGRLA